MLTNTSLTCRKLGDGVRYPLCWNINMQSLGSAKKGILPQPGFATENDVAWISPPEVIDSHERLPDIVQNGRRARKRNPGLGFFLDLSPRHGSRCLCISATTCSRAGKGFLDHLCNSLRLHSKFSITVRVVLSPPNEVANTTSKLIKIPLVKPPRNTYLSRLRIW